MLALYAAIFLVSAATLFLELTLTRLFAVTQWYHFAFMSVSVALLGFGASGTWLSLRPGGAGRQKIGATQSLRSLGRPNDGLRSRLALVALFFAASILAAYLAMNYVPFDSYRIGLERRQLLYLALYYFALVMPFFFAGLFSGLCLAEWPTRSNEVYAANLLGSAVGSLSVLVVVPLLGGARATAVATITGLLASLLLQVPPRPAWTGLRSLAVRAAQCTLLVSLMVLLVRPPSWFATRLSPYKSLSTSLLFPEARSVFSRWNAFSRVDVVQSGAIHSAPGLSLSFKGQLPEQLGLMIDGDNQSPISCIRNPDDELFLQHLTIALPFQLRRDAHSLLIEPRGGLDIWVALHNGSNTVVAVESNPLVVEAVREQTQRCAASIYDDPRVTIVTEDVRGYLRRLPDRFDVLLVSLADSYQPVISGAYGLTEAPVYTTEAFLDHLSHLRDDGLLVVTRWLQSPPSEELRAFVLLTEALRQAGVGDPSRHVLAFRSWSTATMLAKPSPFAEGEIESLRAFCAEHSFDLIYYPGMPAEEANRFNVLPDSLHYILSRQALEENGRQALLSSYPYDVSPPTDDRPFFFHYFKWGQIPAILRGLGRVWQPFGGSGFLVLVVLLVLATLLSLLLILLPLWIAPSVPSHNWPANRAALIPVLGYFTCLGLGFLFVEMPLLQEFIVFLGQPTYAFALVLFSILLFSGLGSLVSPRLPLRPLLLVLSIAALAYPWFLSRLFEATIGSSLSHRLLLTVLGLAPIGFLLGLPLVGGVRLLAEHMSPLIPWAWAVNGCASVIGSILSAMAVVSVGFSRVLATGGLAYGLAFLVVPSLCRLQVQDHT